MEALLAFALAGAWLWFLFRLAIWFSNKMEESDAGRRNRFAWLPVFSYSSMFYRSGSYWLRRVHERKTEYGWRAFDADNPGWKAFRPSSTS